MYLRKGDIAEMLVPKAVEVRQRLLVGWECRSPHAYFFIGVNFAEIWMPPLSGWWSPTLYTKHCNQAVHSVVLFITELFLLLPLPTVVAPSLNFKMCRKRTICTWIKSCFPTHSFFSHLKFCSIFPTVDVMAFLM